MFNSQYPDSLRVFFLDSISNICLLPSYGCWQSMVTVPHNGPIARYVKLGIAHAPGMPGSFSPPQLAIPTCITAHASCTSRDACRDRWLAVAFEVGGVENVSCIPGACATRNFTYLVRANWHQGGTWVFCVVLPSSFTQNSTVGFRLSTSLGLSTARTIQLAISAYSISQEICTRFCYALLCCGYAIVHNEFTWSIYPYSSGLLCWHWGNR